MRKQNPAPAKGQIQKRSGKLTALIPLHAYARLVYHMRSLPIGNASAVPFGSQA